MINNNKRYLHNIINLDALSDYKMAFISGPRQVGKSTLAKEIIQNKTENLFTWDQTTFKKRWIKNPENAVLEHDKSFPIVLDEIHKDRKWKQRLKGLYDLQGDTVKIIVTGSARLDYYRKGGDSLMGRYIPYHLNPFTVAETESPCRSQEIFNKRIINYPWEDLLNLGGFPEPLLHANQSKAIRWSRLRRDRILQEDVKDFRNVSDIEALKILTELLPDKVGSLLSINSLREDIGVAYATVRSWVHILEALYYGFYVRPFSGKIQRMVKAEPKFYLYDILSIETRAKRLENLSALHLLKACQFWTDTADGEFDLYFLRNKDKEEVDFCITRDKKPWMLIECKSGDKQPNKTLIKFSNLFKTEKNFQLVDGKNFSKEYKDHKIIISDYETFFSGFL